ncbi:hypothetical protein CYMTET_31522 [Cymbomonas tetramitiformis]|uniref:Uncharacterized protein n=1 Tax=Cymbomonas tetramitiformis TaxID=36881 RepID=A0AAE0FGM9_9CHLO|nr:hypothetical protein CYMTET_31522 [Cymbomonas tetramitiformis]
MSDSASSAPTSSLPAGGSPQGWGLSTLRLDALGTASERGGGLASHRGARPENPYGTSAQSPGFRTPTNEISTPQPETPTSQATSHATSQFTAFGDFDSPTQSGKRMNSEISAILSEIFTFPVMKLDKVYSRLFGGHAISTAEFRDKLHRLNGALQADFESRTQIEKSVRLEGRLKGYEEGVYAKGMALVAEVSEMNRIVREELEASNCALQKEKQEALAQLQPQRERMEELEIHLASQSLVKDAYFAAVLRAAEEERSRDENVQEASGLVEIMLLREEMNILQKSRARVERQLEASLVENELLNRLRSILETQEVVSKVAAEACLRGALGAADEEILSLNSTNESLVHSPSPPPPPLPRRRWPCR